PLAILAGQADLEALSGAHVLDACEADPGQGIADRLALRIEDLAPRIDRHSCSQIEVPPESGLADRPATSDSAPSSSQGVGRSWAETSRRAAQPSRASVSEIVAAAS